MQKLAKMKAKVLYKQIRNTVTLLLLVKSDVLTGPAVLTCRLNVGIDASMSATLCRLSDRYAGAVP